MTLATSSESPSPLPQGERRSNIRDSFRGSPQAIILTVVVAIVLGSSLWRYAKTYAGIDFYQFWIVPTAVSEGVNMTRYAETAERRAHGERYYERFRVGPDWRVRLTAENRRHLETLGTPFLYYVFRAFSGNEYSADYLRYQFVAIVMFLITIVFFALFFGHSWFGAGVLLTVFCFAWEPTLSDIRVANVSRLLLSTLCLCVVLRSPLCRPWLRHASFAILGISLMFKPLFIGSLVLVVWLNLLAGRWRSLVCDLSWVGVGALLAVSASVAYFQDWDIWLMWAREFGAIKDDIITPLQGNYAPVLTIEELTGLSQRSVALGMFCIVLVVVTALWRRALGGSQAMAPSSEEFYRLEVGAFVGGMLFLFFVSKLVWLHYISLLIPLFIVLLRPQAVFSWKHLAQYLFAALAIVLLGLETWRTWVDTSPVFHLQIATLAGLICAACAACLDQWSATVPVHSSTCR